MSDFGPALNRLGLVLTFLSVWLLWPEVLGEARLQRIERVTQWLLESGFPGFGAFLVQAVILGGVGVLAFYVGLFDVIGKSRTTDRFIGTVVLLPVWIMIAIAGELARKLFSTTIFRPLLQAMARRERLRRRLADLGLGLLACGFLLQLAATYVHEK